MPRNLVFLIVFFIVVVTALFFLASVDSERELKPVEKPAIGGELG